MNDLAFSVLTSTFVEGMNHTTDTLLDAGICFF